MDFKEFCSKIASKEIVVKGINGINVADNADPNNVAKAVEMAKQADQLSQQAKSLFMQNRFEEATTYLAQSIVLEDSLGNLFGVASDLGNLANIYLEMGKVDEAIAGFEKAIEIDVRLLVELFNRHVSNHTTPVDLVVENKLMQGLHLEGLARCLIKKKQFISAAKKTTEAIKAYREARSSSHEAQAQELLTWLAKRAG